MASHTIGLGKEEPSMREEWMEKVNTAPLSTLLVLIIVLTCTLILVLIPISIIIVLTCIAIDKVEDLGTHVL